MGWFKTKADTGSKGQPVGAHRAAPGKPSTMQVTTEKHKAWGKTNYTTRTQNTVRAVASRRKRWWE